MDYSVLNGFILAVDNPSVRVLTCPNKCSSQTCVLFSLQQHTKIVIHAPLLVKSLMCNFEKECFSIRLKRESNPSKTGNIRKQVGSKDPNI